ncbi:MAG: glutamate--cysteine ligase [Gammaproteobacteria bacterium]|nr:glutamate--cysteine ligase [Gammaproteobacteria bacterium]
MDRWFEQQWLSTPPPVYGSIDLRHAGFKLAPIDMNLYPAGFNNLSQTSFMQAIEAIQSLMRQRYPSAKSVMLIPENHSRNQFYWENINTLSFLLREAGLDVRIGGDPTFFPQNTAIQLAHGGHIVVEPIQRQAQRLVLDHYDPSLIWLNNDFSSGAPAYVNDIEQPMCPPPELGWHSRLKTTHFSHYRDVAAEFSDLLSIDPWLIDPLFLCCDNVDFMQREGEWCLTTNVEALLKAIQKKI